ncbi:GNAT family N-acetyltransferase [Haloarcula sp. Atlit-7R]|uniref:GNAT family N-acetyltransferase n=1 Tax=Haloarcula sp. Atlit-7R TaxID=2282125 RepID=UPI000EF174FE|nr:GNAT family N-acetyltransferase [Haloarcula sp. Atlit-7R]RLM96225.1 N-acetyltransferase [Haloarcula sp. Atlit-7R]
MTYPDRALSHEEVTSIDSESEEAFVIPYYLMNRQEKYTFSLIRYSDSSIKFEFFNPKSGIWENLRSINLDDASIETQVDSFYTKDLRIFGEVSREVEDQYVVLGQKLESLYGEPMIPYDHQSAKTMFDRITPQQCSCSDHSIDPTPTVFEVTNGKDIPMTICDQCGKTQEIIVGNDRIGYSNFLNSQSVIDSIEPHDQYHGDTGEFLRVKPSGSGIPHYVIGTLISLSNDEVSPATDYDLNEVEALISITDGNISGIAVWANGTFDHPILRQLYVLPEFRRQGIATELTEMWISEVVSGNTAYADDPNPESRKLLDNIRNNPEFKNFDLIEFVRFSPIGIEMSSSLWSTLSNQSLPN